ncbi:putative oxidoreductase [Mycobacterium xenopi 3993]|nr:putative oxidoreductase [Mycobacterium xenopi 3993]
MRAPQPSARSQDWIRQAKGPGAAQRRRCARLGVGGVAGHGRASSRRHPDFWFGGGNSPIPYNATYAATKAFVNTFSESLRGELRRTGVHVTLLAPGPVRSELPDPAEASLVDKLVPKFLWISTEHTARVSLDALARNKMRVVPGLTSKAMSVASQYAPRAIVARSWAASTRSSAGSATGGAGGCPSCRG